MTLSTGGSRIKRQGNFTRLLTGEAFRAQQLSDPNQAVLLSQAAATLNLRRFMKTVRTRTFFAASLLAGFAALILWLGGVTPSVRASSEQSGRLRITKECSAYTGGAGSFCTITSSNFAAIPIGSKVLYDQAAGVPAGLLDSNVVLDAGNGNRAVGRCTLDGATSVGICTFSDGIGELAGFHARVDVSPFPGDLVNYHWRGTYSFAELGRQHDEHGDR
jgi:hypothetical protein